MQGSILRWKNGSVVVSCGALLLGFLISRGLGTFFSPQTRLEPRSRSVGIQPKNILPDYKPYKNAWYGVIDSVTTKRVIDFTASRIARPGVQERGTVRVEEGGIVLDGSFMEDEHLEVAASGYSRFLVRFEHLNRPGQALPLIPARTLRIRTVDASNDAPVSGAFVALDQPGGEANAATTDDSGWAEFEDASVQFLPGKHGTLVHQIPITVRAAGFLPARTAVVLDNGAGPFLLRLDPAVALDLMVADGESGLPVPDTAVVHQFSVGERGQANQFEEVQVTDGEGFVRISVPRAVSAVDLVAHHPDYAPKQALLAGSQLLASLDGLGRVVLELERGYPVEGAVLDIRDQPVKGAVVELSPIEKAGFSGWGRFACFRFFGYLPDQAYTDSEGAFRLANMAAGEYRIISVHRDFLPDLDSKPLSVGNDGASWVGLLRDGKVLQGSVVDEKTQALEGVQVVLAYVGSVQGGDSWFSKTTETGPNGSFELKGVEEGHYRALFLTGAGLVPHRQEIDTASPPVPWRVVLHERRDG